MFCREHPSKKVNCFAYKEGECICLGDTYFKDGVCKFFKTKEQHEKDKKKFNRK